MMCLQELQKPAASCSIPEPARTLALMELRGLHGVHYNILATFTGSAWDLVGGDCAHLMRDLPGTTGGRSGRTRPPPTSSRDSRRSCTRTSSSTRLLSTSGSLPNTRSLAAKRIADWVEQFDEKEGFKAALRTVASICTRTASGVEQCPCRLKRRAKSHHVLERTRELIQSERRRAKEGRRGTISIVTTGMHGITRLMLDAAGGRQVYTADVDA